MLADRLWPRGVSKEHATLDHWMKEIAPTTHLRKWFGHDPARWEEFARRYDAELHGNADVLSQLRALAREARITLVYSAHDEVHNDAIVLRNVLQGRKGRGRPRQIASRVAAVRRGTISVARIFGKHSHA